MNHSRAAGVAGVAGVSYLVLAGLESVDVQDRPGLDAPDAEVLGYYATHSAEVWVTTSLGWVALCSYVAFIVGLWRLLPVPERKHGAGLLLLGAGLIGPAVAAMSAAYRVAAVAGASAGAGGSATVASHAASSQLRSAGGVLIGVTLIGAAVAAGFRTRVLPRWLAVAAVVVGGFTTSASLAAVAGSVPDALAVVGPAAGAVWVAVAGTWLLLPGVDMTLSRRRRVATVLARLIFFAVAVAAGISGAALVAFPAATSTYFSWPLGPPALAATIGANYLLAAAAYGMALRDGGPGRRWGEARTMLVGVVALSLPIFLVTLGHLAAFDLARWQAWAWLVLFAAFPIAAAGTLWSFGAPVAPGDGDGRPRPVMRAALWIYAGAFAALALVALIRPSLAAGPPLSAGPLGVRVLAGWLVFAATLAALSASRPRAETRAARAVLPWFPVAFVLVHAVAQLAA